MCIRDRPVEEQEKVIGRRKFNDVELSDEEKPQNAHNAVTNIGDCLLYTSIFIAGVSNFGSTLFLIIFSMMSGTATIRLGFTSGHAFSEPPGMIEAPFKAPSSPPDLSLIHISQFSDHHQY